ncbi:MAG: DNA-3-methyladenine glycosylase I [Hyphomicrobiales bacterium]|nr:DNA-3-methyladenine glycosylase I [Hyphomicrobiales bacterium]
MVPFAEIREIAAKRKGGDEVLDSLLRAVPDNEALSQIPDSRILAEMTRRIFSAGFVWRVIEVKWPGFEEAFLEFKPERLVFQPDEYWDGLAKDTRIVRNAQKIAAVRHNAHFVRDIADEHGSFGRFLADWPSRDLVGLLDVLAKRGSRLGGHTGQYFLRFVGKDGFVASKDVVACLRSVGVEIAERPTSKRDLKRVQEQFNAWAEETGLPLTHLSRICAMSIGENYDLETLRGHGVVEAGSA